MPPPSAKTPHVPARKPQAAAPRWIKPVILVLSAFFLMGWFAIPVANSDTWWQLKTGEYVWQHHALPVPDPFSYTTYMHTAAYAGEEITRHFNLTHEWLSQVLFYLAYAAGGFPGLILFRAALLTAFCGTVALVAYRRTREFYRAMQRTAPFFTTLPTRLTLPKVNSSGGMTITAYCRQLPKYARTPSHQLAEIKYANL